MEGDYISGTPGAFLRDCAESGVDVGFYDDIPRLWIACPRHIRNAFERAKYYIDPNGPNQCPRGLKVAAGAQMGLWEVCIS
jgi:hypothetical protein